MTKLLLKITCHTPKGKAKQCEKEWRKQFPSFKKPIKKAIPDESHFWWIYEFDKEKDLYSFQKKCLLAETGIRKMYGFMIRFFKRANKLMNKSAWTAKKVKNWIIKRWEKTMKGNEDQIERVKLMDEQEFKDYIKINDLEEMEKFLARDQLIETKMIDEGEF